MRTEEIMVGTDGTAASLAAVRWAAREAQRRRLLLRIVHVFDRRRQPDEPGGDPGHLDAPGRFAAAVIANASAQARAIAPEIRLELDTLIGDPALRLLTAAVDTDLVVLGSRGHGGFAGLTLGSVSRRVAVHAPCPVVVVRGRGMVGEGAVVAGVDDSPAAETVLAAAFEAAAGRAAGLTVVRSCPAPPPLWMAGVPVADTATPKEDAAERRGVEELLAPWRRRYPEVKVEVLVSHDSPAAVLVRVSHGAQLVVVGNRGHGTVLSALLGSTGVQLLHHADCPVLIARPPRIPTERRKS